MDGSHIDVERHLSLRCHLINLGGCTINYGKGPGCELFSEVAVAVDDDTCTCVLPTAPPARR